MNKTKLAAPTKVGKNGTTTKRKDRQSWPIIKQSLPLNQRKVIALQMLKNGQRATAVELNRAIGFNDARRWITTLRRTLLDYEVHKTRLNDNRALYWLKPVEAAPTLFSGEGVRHE